MQRYTFFSYDANELIAIYAVLVCCMALFAVYVLKERFPKQGKGVFSFFFLMMLILPGAGVGISVWMIYLLKYTHYKKEEKSYRTIRFDEFFTRFPVVKRKLGESALHEIVYQQSTHPLALHLTALSIHAESIDKSHFTLIKKMLSSNNDEIRLFSFSVVDGMEQKINAKIHQTMQVYQDTTVSLEQKAKAAHTLALLYWELIYFELVDDVLMVYLLDDVEHYAKEALSFFSDDYRIYVLLGRVFFEKKAYEKAKAYFQKAIEVGSISHLDDIHFVQAYLAEIAFDQRAYKEVKRIIGSTAYFELVDKLKPIQEVWK